MKILSYVVFTSTKLGCFGLKTEKLTVGDVVFYSGMILGMIIFSVLVFPMILRFLEYTSTCKYCL